ncbi:fibronectin type III domain-containing protein [Euzebya sp.]|uniref:fibronectin type III domain-containing protein n=1 Tax=Euzebya sp. TaxID=1971409 RepID=UPI003515CE18
MGVPLTRRQALAYAGLVGATVAAPTAGWGRAPARAAVRSGPGLAGFSQAGTAVPMHLELVTVTDTTATLTWYTGDPTDLDPYGRPAPVAAPGRVLLGTSPAPSSWEEVAAHDPTPYHHVELTGLTPGTRYWFRAESAGVPALATTFDPADLHPLRLLVTGEDLSGLDLSNLGTFTTLVPPPGAEVLRVAWFNDMHFGELISGIVTGDLPDPVFPDGFPAGLRVDPDNPYWRITGNAAIAEAIGRGAGFLMVNGDLTNEAEPAALEEVRASLDAFGTLGSCRRTAAGDFLVSAGDPPAYWVTRGNHDRAHQGEGYGSGTPVEGFEGFRDTFHATFADSWAPGSATSRFTVVADSPTTRWRFVGLDSSTDPTNTGTLPTEQLEFLEASLVAADEPAFVLVHHPAGEENQLVGLPPAIAGVSDVEGSAAFREILAGAGESVVGVYQGHTHRTNATRSPLSTGPLPFYEGASTKEYPAGYSMLRLFEGGYMVNFHTCADPEARAWAEQSRAEYYGGYPYYTLGSLQDRNWTYEVDARRTTTAGGGACPADVGHYVRPRG